MSLWLGRQTLTDPTSKTFGCVHKRKHKKDRTSVTNKRGKYVNTLGEYSLIQLFTMFNNRFVCHPSLMLYLGRSFKYASIRCIDFSLLIWIKFVIQCKT